MSVGASSTALPGTSESRMALREADTTTLSFSPAGRSTMVSGSESVLQSSVVSAKPGAETRTVPEESGTAENENSPVAPLVVAFSKCAERSAIEAPEIAAPVGSRTNPVTSLCCADAGTARIAAISSVIRTGHRQRRLGWEIMQACACQSAYSSAEEFTPASARVQSDSARAGPGPPTPQL